MPDGVGPGRLLVVMAHPDDESFACGGTIALAADRGHEVTLLCATRGGAGTPLPGWTPGELATREALMAVRTEELHQAGRVLGIARIELLTHRDGFLRWAPAGTLEIEIAAAIEDVRPDAVLTFGADGLYWHPDHIALWERTDQAVRQATACRPAVYHVLIPQGTVEGLVADVRATSPDADERLFDIPSYAFGMLAPPPTLAIDVRPVIDRKLAALRAHASQVGPRHLLTRVDRVTAMRWLGTEYYHLASDSPSPRSFLDDFAAPPPV
jgi:LmbE family N-acetylglucosaminyl deacetylase